VTRSQAVVSGDTLETLAFTRNGKRAEPPEAVAKIEERQPRNTPEDSTRRRLT